MFLNVRIHELTFEDKLLKRLLLSSKVNSWIMTHGPEASGTEDSGTEDGPQVGVLNLTQNRGSLNLDDVIQIVNAEC